MKIILNYDPATSNISDKNGMFLMTWVGLEYEEMHDSQAIQAPPALDGEQLIRMMKIVANVEKPENVKDI